MSEWLLVAALGVTGAGAGALAYAWRRRRPWQVQRDRSGVGSGGGGGSATPRDVALAGPMSGAPASAPEIERTSIATMLESAWRAPLDDARTRMEINQAIAESAMRTQRPRNPFGDEAGRRRAVQLIRDIRTGADDVAWAALEPLTTSGEFLHLVEHARSHGGEFGAQSLQACARRLWGARLARSRDAARRTQRRADPA
jgi:hypothetical protein